ncbi:MAG: FeoB-associated Cys-rich membrane protein [Verrucomicrobia bacterium]|nr:FeoB-associated Cys-rich membrane protein [Verrucomicrobiota bacterium]
MSSDWQSWITLGIIILTATIFIRKAIIKRRKKDAGCGHDCGCPSKPDLKKKDD